MLPRMRSRMEALNRRDQLNAMSVACDAIMILGKRYADLAREMAAECTGVTPPVLMLAKSV